MRLIEADARMGRGGAALSALACAIIAAGLTSPPDGGRLLLVQWGASLALVVCLCRVSMPSLLRAGLAAAVLGVALGDAAGVDPVRVDARTRRVERTIAAAKADRARAAASATDAAGARAGVRIDLAGAWGARIGGALDGRIGGAPASILSIDGRADATSEPDAIRIAVRWSIGRAGTRQSCGSTTVSGRTEAAIVDAVGASFDRAVRASLATETAACA